MPLPAGTGLEPALVPAALRGRDAGGLRRLDALAAQPRRGDRPGGGRGAARPAGARVDLHGRRLGLPVGARAGEGSPLPRTAPLAGPAAKAPGRRSQRGRKPDVAPAGRRAGANSTAKARSRCSRRSATTRPTRATSPAATTGRSASSNAQMRSGWMGRYLDVAGEPANPLQGLSLDYSLAPALATAQMPVAAVVHALGLQLLGLRPGRTARRADAGRPSARSARSAPARPRSRRRARRRSTRASSARRWRRSPNTKANRASPRR